MTPNDAQIDLLLRRHAGHAEPRNARGNSAIEHLDADELGAFAEGSLSAAARSRYVSHLADCDDCRKVASQLALAGGPVAASEATTVAGRQGYSWWKRLSGFFSPPTLRYAVFAFVLVAAAGAVFLFTQRPRESALIAQRDSTNQPAAAAVKPAEPAGSPARADESLQNQNKQFDSTSRVAPTPPAPMVSKPNETKAAEGSVPPPKPEAETAIPTSPVPAARKAAEPQSPSYASPPPGEIARSGTVLSERQNVPRDVASGPRKTEGLFDKSKTMDRSRASDSPKDLRAVEENARVAQPSAGNRNAEDEKAAPRREADTLASRDRNVKEGRAQTSAPQSAGTVNRASTEEAPETRSVGGRKFRRQGNAWVDAKFKSSMTLKSISRGSSEFAALDSKLRSIVEQISGEVIVVWKNKAYLIR